MPNMIGDPGGGEHSINPFGRSSLTPHSSIGSSHKRGLGDLSPTNLSPCEKRMHCVTDSPENTSSINSSTLNIDSEYFDFIRESSDCLSKINDIVNEQSSRINVANKTAIMDMTQRITAIVSMLAIKSSATETKLARVERDLISAKLMSLKYPTNVETKSDNKLSYVDTLKLRLPKQTQPVQTRPPLPCIVAYPTEERASELTSSSATKEALMKAIKPSDGFQIVGVKKTAKSGVVLRVVLRYSNEAQIKKLESVEGIKSAGLRLEKPKGRRPRILIKDVPENMDDKRFLAALYSQNVKGELNFIFIFLIKSFSLENDFIKNIKIVRRRSAAYGRKWIGIELSPEIHSHFIGTKDKLFIDFATCRFVDDLEVVRCLKCQQYGHVSKYCNESKSTCAHCSGQHDTRECTKIKETEFKPVCASCRRLKKADNHKTGSQSCPTYCSRLQQLILNTTYG
ncbi:LOW QUALITY PROTEIN: uncharacterized protein ACR2FA_008698 [Aphomia sociella]